MWEDEVYLTPHEQLDGSDRQRSSTINPFNVSLLWCIKNATDTLTDQLQQVEDVSGEAASVVGSQTGMQMSVRVQIFTGKYWTPEGKFRVFTSIERFLHRHSRLVQSQTSLRRVVFPSTVSGQRTPDCLEAGCDDARWASLISFFFCSSTFVCLLVYFQLSCVPGVLFPSCAPHWHWPVPSVSPPAAHSLVRLVCIQACVVPSISLLVYLVPLILHFPSVPSCAPGASLVCTSFVSSWICPRPLLVGFVSRFPTSDFGLKLTFCFQPAFLCPHDYLRTVTALSSCRDESQLPLLDRILHPVFFYCFFRATAWREPWKSLMRSRSWLPRTVAQFNSAAFKHHWFKPRHSDWHKPCMMHLAISFTRERPACWQSRCQLKGLLAKQHEVRTVEPGSAFKVSSSGKTLQ